VEISEKIVYINQTGNFMWRNTSYECKMNDKGIMGRLAGDSAEQNTKAVLEPPQK